MHNVVMPSSRYAHSMPSFSIAAFSPTVMTAPPEAAPQEMSPFARPRFVLKYCAGIEDTICGCQSPSQLKIIQNALPRSIRWSSMLIFRTDRR